MDEKLVKKGRRRNGETSKKKRRKGTLEIG